MIDESHEETSLFDFWERLGNEFLGNVRGGGYEFI